MEELDKTADKRENQWRAGRGWEVEEEKKGAGKNCFVKEKQLIHVKTPFVENIKHFSLSNGKFILSSTAQELLSDLDWSIACCGSEVHVCCPFGQIVDENIWRKTNLILFFKSHDT